jgi:hypothetical protein
MDFFTVPTVTFSVLYWHAALPIMPTSGKYFPISPVWRGIPRSSDELRSA